MKYSVGIIGLGKIGMMYDTDVDDTSSFLSHAKSFYHHPSFNISFLLDVRAESRVEARRRFPGVTVLGELPDTDADVVVLAATQEVNLGYLEQLTSNPWIKLFVVEKPFWSSSVPESWKDDPRIYVNYTRRSLPYYAKLRRRIADGELGDPLAATVYYSKGLRNNGSHLIDFLNYLVPFASGECLEVFRRVEDFTVDDPSLSFVMNVEAAGRRIPVVFVALDERYYSLIELDIFFSAGRLRLYDFGGSVDIYRTRSDALYPGYTNLLPDEVRASTALEKNGLLLCEKIARILDGVMANDSPAANDKFIFDMIQEIRSKA